MLTHSRASRFRPGLLLGAFLLLLAVVASMPVTSRADCRPVPASAWHVEAATIPPEPVGGGVAARSRGVDLEVRLLNVRIEFPWLARLPITPARRIVISWMAADGRE